MNKGILDGLEISVDFETKYFKLKIRIKKKSK